MRTFWEKISLWALVILTIEGVEEAGWSMVGYDPEWYYYAALAVWSLSGGHTFVQRVKVEK